MAAYDAVIEIPRGSRNKYEIDHATGRVSCEQPAARTRTSAVPTISRLRT